MLASKENLQHDQTHVIIGAASGCNNTSHRSHDFIQNIGTHLPAKKIAYADLDLLILIQSESTVQAKTKRTVLETLRQDRSVQLLHKIETRKIRVRHSVYNGSEVDFSFTLTYHIPSCLWLLEQ